MSYVTTTSSLGTLQYNTGRGIFRPGGYGGGIFDGNIAGLGSITDWLLNPWGSTAAAVTAPEGSGEGAEAGSAAGQQAAATVTGSGAGTSAGAQVSAASSGSYPWGAYSSATLALQKSTNVALKQYGYCPVGEDGKLGPATCGARQALKSVIPGMTNPDTCQKFTAPSKAPCGGGGSGGSAPLSPEQQAALVAQYGGGSNWKKYLLFAGGAALVIGAAYYIDKKRRK